MTSYTEGSALSSEHRSRLKELNLSHNKLTECPLGLSCVAPYLEKLVLSYNQLTQIGPIEVYPVNLKSLDLSFNQLMSEEEHAVSGGSGGGSLSLARDIVGGATSPPLGGLIVPSPAEGSSVCYSPLASRT